MNSMFILLIGVASNYTMTLSLQYRSTQYFKKDINQRKMSKPHSQTSRISLVFLIAVSMAICLASSEVVQLTDANLDQTIADNKYVLVKFYAPWCGHCKSMAEDYIKLAELAADNGIVIGQLEATENKQSAKKHNVEGYPMIKLFVDGQPIDYSGARTTDEMYGWIKKVSEKKLQKVTEEEIKALVGTKAFAVYKGKDQNKIKVMETLNLMDETANYYLNEESDEEALYLYKKTPQNGEAESIVFAHEFNTDIIKQWIISQTLPIVIPLSSKEYLDWVFYDMETMRDVAMLIKEDDLSDSEFDNFKALCKENQKSYKCCYIDNDMQVYGGVCNYLRCGGEKSVLALVRDTLKEAYNYPGQIGSITTQSFEEFGQQVNDKKHKNLAEMEEKKVEYEHAVSLNDETFEDYTQQNELVFVEFYSPGCQHCLQFAPVYDKFAQEVKQVSGQLGGLKVAAIDLQKSPLTAQKTKVTSFPSFRLYVDGEEVPYEGPRSKESILNFIENTKTNLPIEAGSIAQIPTPAIIIYDSAEKSSLRRLPGLFTRLPVYRLKQGSASQNTVKVVARLEDQTHSYPPESTPEAEISLETVSKWLAKLTEPVLVNLLNPNMDSKLMEALQSKSTIIGFVDIEESLSESTLNLLQKYCKQSNLVCGYAKKNQEHFNDFTTWLGIQDSEGAKSELIYIDTTSFDKYRFDQGVESLNEDNLSEWIGQVKEGKVEKWSGDSPKTEVPQAETVKETSETKQQESTSSSNSEEKVNDEL